MKDCKRKRPCGCSDKFLESLPSCNRVECSNGEPCSEVFSAECIVYTGNALPEFGINNGDRLNIVLEKMLLFVSGECVSSNCDCFPVVGLQTNVINAQDVTLIWINNTSTSFELEYKEVDELAWNILAVSSNNPIVSYTLGNLTSDTEYEVRVRSICDSGSATSLTIRFKTI
jgi:hypothetical protein